jgi:hypothetical protein
MDKANPMDLFLWPQYCRAQSPIFLHCLPHNTIWYKLGWSSLVTFKMKVKVKVEVNTFLCLIMHLHINVRSDKCIIVVSFAAYYMKGDSN